MSTLPYATPSDTSPRYARLVLGSGLLAFASLILLVVPLLARQVLSDPLVGMGSKSVYWFQVSATSVAWLLMVPAVAALGTFRHATSYATAIFWTALTAGFVVVIVTLSVASPGIDWSQPLSPAAIL